MSEKVCSKCKETKPLTLFPKNKSNSNGYHSWCKACICINTQLYRSVHFEEIKAKELANIEEVRAKRKVYYQANLEKSKKYRKEYYKKHYEELNAKCRIKAQEKRWMNRDLGKPIKSTKEEKAARARAHRDALVRSLNENFTKPQRAFVHSFWDETCAICGKIQEEEISCVFTIDHWMPISKGYPLTMSNAVLLCKHCNSKKHSKYPSEIFEAATIMWIESQLRKQVKQFTLSKREKDACKTV